jgi:hypothetical protein
MTRPLDPVSTSSVDGSPAPIAAWIVGSVTMFMVIGRVQEPSTSAGSAPVTAAAVAESADGNRKSNDVFKLASRLSVQLVRSSAAAGSKTAIESVSDVRNGWRIGSRRSSKSAFAGAAEPAAMAVAATNAPALSPTPDNRRRRVLPACSLP